MFFALISIYFLVQCIESYDVKWVILSAIATGIMLMFRVHFVTIMFLSLLAIGMQRRWWDLLLFPTVAASVYIPQVLYNRLASLNIGTPGYNPWLPGYLYFGVIDVMADTAYYYDNSAFNMVGCNMTDTETLQDRLDTLNFDWKLPTIVFCECSLTYVEASQSISLLCWLTRKISKMLFIDYEQIRPFDSFGKIMVRHFKNRNSALKCVEYYKKCGFRSDKDGNIWTSAGKAIKCFNPNNELIGQILVPELVSNLEFGGKEGNILYVTATSSLYKMELNQVGEKFK